jgi:hypothetical protein
VACERYEAEGGQFVADEERHGQTITGITRSRHVNLAEVGAQNTGRLRRSILGARDKVALNGEWRLRVAILKMNLPNHSVLSGGKTSLTISVNVNVSVAGMLGLSCCLSTTQAATGEAEGSTEPGGPAMFHDMRVSA